MALEVYLSDYTTKLNNSWKSGLSVKKMDRRIKPFFYLKKQQTLYPDMVATTPVFLSKFSFISEIIIFFTKYFLFIKKTQFFCEKPKEFRNQIYMNFQIYRHSSQYLWVQCLSVFKPISQANSSIYTFLREPIIFHENVFLRKKKISKMKRQID